MVNSSVFPATIVQLVNIIKLFNSILPYCLLYHFFYIKNPAKSEMEQDCGKCFIILRKLGHVTRLALGLITYILYKPFLRKVSAGTFIHPFASLRNLRNISIGRNVKINRNTIIWPSILEVGDNVEINPGVTIYGKVFIASDVLIGPNSVISGGNHDTAKVMPIRLQGSTSLGVSIESDVWIGANVVILDGLTIKQGSVIAAGAVVTKDTEEFKIYAGVPAKVISQRT